MAAMVSNVRDIGSRIGSDVKVDSIGQAGIGAIVYILAVPGGDVSLDDLTTALTAEGSHATPPEAPSRRDRTARAASKVAKAHTFSCVSRRKIAGARRGTDGWELVRGSHVDTSGSGALGDRVSPIVATAREGSFDGEQSIVNELVAAYDAVSDVLTGDDISAWFTAKVAGLGGIAIKGGVYYLPPESAVKFAKLTAAIQRASAGRYEVHAAPVGNAEGGLRVVLSALVHDTADSVTEIQKSIEDGVGRKALETREKTCADLLARLTRYAALLGPKLDEIKVSVESARASVAVAMLAANTEDDAE